MIGRQLLEEVEQRRWIDAVLTLSPFEAELEKWLGTAKIHWVPRTIIECTLEFNSVDGRVGCVSTLDHPPNFWGLVQLFDALDEAAPDSFRFRLVGQPRDAGRQLAKRYSFVEYLGPLSDQQLRQEAGTWCCFAHPLFEYAKGCSTKLGVCLGWGLPVATTEFGVRGYRWDVQAVPLAKTPVELASLVLARCTAAHFATHRQAMTAIWKNTPSASSIGSDIRDFLLAERNEEGSMKWQFAARSR
jgi:hypothetical protein